MAQLSGTRPARPIRSWLWGASVLILAVLQGANAVQASTASEQLLALKQSVIRNYAAIAHASYDDALAGVCVLADAIDSFLYTERGVTESRAQGLDGRADPYPDRGIPFLRWPHRSGRRTDQLVADRREPHRLRRRRTGCRDHQHTDTFPRDHRRLIVSLNEKDGEKNITAGYHAIEFLLWGQDSNEDGPRHAFLQRLCDRTPHADRRRDYLRLAAALLVGISESVVAAWAPGAGLELSRALRRHAADEALVAS